MEYRSHQKNIGQKNLDIACYLHKDAIIDSMCLLYSSVDLSLDSIHNDTSIDKDLFQLNLL